MTNYDVVKKLIGEIEPIGETNTDNKHFDNLQEMIKLVDDLLNDLDAVSYNKIRNEYSMKRAGKRACQFLKGIRYFD